MNERIQTALIVGVATVLMAALPLLGLRLAGRAVAPYLQFPPTTQRVEPAPFAWPAFAGLAAAIAATLLPFALRVARGCPRHGPVTSAARATAPRTTGPLVHASTLDASSHRAGPGVARGYPWWAWAGLALVLAAWAAAWTRAPALAGARLYTFTPLWLGYILAVNGLTWRRTGHCLLTGRPGFMAALCAASAGFWWFFEYLNRFAVNWHYEGIGVLTPLRYFLFATLPFATVLPAVLSTAEWLQAATRWAEALQAFAPLHAPRPRTAAALTLAAAGAALTGLGLWPDWLFPILWLAPLAILLALQALAGQRTLLAPLRDGDWRRVAHLAAAALVCGVFWELWNDGSEARWVYTVPYVGRFHVFEMPILGFAGYLPFGLECGVMADLVERLVARSDIAPCRAHTGWPAISERGQALPDGCHSNSRACHTGVARTRERVVS